MKKKSRIFFCSMILLGNFIGNKVFCGKIHDIVQEGCIDQLKNFFETERGLSVINSCDDMEKTALYYACKKGDVNMVKFLYNMGGNVHAITKDSLNLLHIACMLDHQELIDFLVYRGVNSQFLNAYNKLPYDMLCDHTTACLQDKKRCKELFERAVFWQQAFKQKKGARTFFDILTVHTNLERNNNHNTEDYVFLSSLNLKMGFCLAYNQAMVGFFSELYDELYSKGFYGYTSQQQSIENQNIFEILFGMSKKLDLKKIYQAFFIKKALQEKNSEFCAAALDADWEYDQKKLDKAICNNFSPYQKDMISKVIVGKKMSTIKGDINLVYRLNQDRLL